MPKTLFIGLGTTAPCYYRIALPSKYLEDSDWVGFVDGPPGKGHIVGGSVEEVNEDIYDVFVVQQAKGEDWLAWIDGKQKQGKKVVYEVDDFLHGVRKIKDHKHQKDFHKKNLKKYEDCMRQADAMICSTDFLSEQYSKYNSNQFVCKNGIDTDRYNVKVPERNYVVVGWAGGTGHHKAVGPWLEAVSDAMNMNQSIGFASVGVPYATALEERHPNRCLSVPWVGIENYPYALSNLDIVIAPAHDSKFFKSKSDLRVLEASAMGFPSIASPITYSDTIAYIADSPEEVTDKILDYVNNPESIRNDGENAREWVTEKRDIRIMKNQWESALSQLG